MHSVGLHLRRTQGGIYFGALVMVEVTSITGGLYDFRAAISQRGNWGFIPTHQSRLPIDESQDTVPQIKKFEKWLKAHSVGRYRITEMGRIFFENEQDAMLFALTW